MKTLKWVAIISGPLLLLTAAVIGFSLKGSAGWEAMKRRHEARIARAEARDPARPPIHGTAVPGDAMKDYREAYDLLEITDDDHELIRTFLNHDAGAVDRTLIELLVSASEPAFARLARGAQRDRAETEASMKYLPLSSWKMPIVIPQRHVLALTALCKVKLLREAGRHQEASDLLLVLCQFGRDLMFNEYWWDTGCAIDVLAWALQELGDQISSIDWKEVDASQIAKAMEALDRQVPPFWHMLDNEARAAQDRLLRVDSEIGFFKSWKTGFSHRRTGADASEAAEGIIEGAASLDSIPWAEARKIIADVDKTQERLAKTGNAYLAEGVPGMHLFKMSGAYRSLHAAIRIVRIAAEFRATGRELDLPDPFGTRIKTSMASGRFKIWSVGADGVDDRGAGSWTDGELPDLVLDCHP